MSIARPPSDLTRTILERCRSLGFALAGVAPAQPARWADELRRWIDRGEHGEMAYMAKNIEMRTDPRCLLPGARSVICVADRYSRGARDRITGEPRGRVARYARGDDYHVVMKKRLHALCDDLAKQFPDAQFRACVDTAPLLEREYAATAGLGAIGKNTMLISQGDGSYLLLGEVVTTLDLQPSESLADDDPCGSCTRCIDACPTEAITPWNVDATKCISYITIEHRSLIDEQHHEAMDDWIFGCDICQEVCPHNQPTRRRRAMNDVHSAYEEQRQDFDLLEVLNWDEQARREAFVRSSMKRAKLAMMKRNALVAAGNWAKSQQDTKATSQHDRSAGPQVHRSTDDAVLELLARIEEIAQDDREEEMVRETARVALRHFGEADVR